MTVAETINMSYNSNCTQSAFEWVAEGYDALIYLNMSSSLELTESTLAAVRKRCHKLRRLNIAD